MTLLPQPPEAGVTDNRTRTSTLNKKQKPLDQGEGEPKAAYGIFLDSPRAVSFISLLYGVNCRVNWDLVVAVFLVLVF